MVCCSNIKQETKEAYGYNNKSLLTCMGVQAFDNDRIKGKKTANEQNEN